jgi:hypothetical protein
MSVPQQPAEHCGASTQDAGRTLDAAARPFNLLDTYAERLFSAEMMELFGMSRSAFSRELQKHAFDRFEILPRIGRRKWSRELLRPYLAGAMRPDARWRKRSA